MGSAKKERAQTKRAAKQVTGTGTGVPSEEPEMYVEIIPQFSFCCMVSCDSAEAGIVSRGHTF